MAYFGFLPTLPSLLTKQDVPFIHRDLSWLQFNERVLSEAQQESNPLLERAKFLAITSSNLDEFFMIRLASLGRSIQVASRSPEGDGERLIRVRTSILETVAKFGVKQMEALDLLSSELQEHGIWIIRHAREGEVAYALGKKIFDEQILPKLGAPEGFTPSKIGLLENLQMGAVFKNDIWFRIPRSLPSVLSARDENDSEKIYYFFLDDLLGTYLGPSFRLEGQCGFLRLTRDGDFTVDLEEEDTESIPDVVRSGLGTREKGRPVRLQYSGDLKVSLLHDATRTLKLISAQILPAAHTMGLQGLWAVVNQTPEDFKSSKALRYPPLQAIVPRPLRNQALIFSEVKKQDILLHHPYDSFDGYVAWIQAACEDPQVLRIEQTVYRMDTLSPVIEALKKAASRKKIRVIIELRARFDELNNLSLADELRKAGVEVAFGFGKLKLHAKVALVTRKEEGGETLYTHLSTGNYNALTARQYTDLAILTANAEIGADARVFFDAVWDGQIPTSFKRLVSAPAKLHRRLLNHIQSETEAAKLGKKARIVAKVNALVDSVVIDNLYKASQAGVQVELIVRGACSLIPGVKGLSENIRVISIVDRFLEHSRIYYFESQKTLYISSADWMPRNFFSRLEIAFPVLDPLLYRYLEEVVIPAYLSDTVKAKELTPQGTWKKRALNSLPPGVALPTPVVGRKAIRSQFLFENLALQEYKGSPLE